MSSNGSDPLVDIISLSSSNDPTCPCPEVLHFVRDLQESNATKASTSSSGAVAEEFELWEAIYTTIVLILMFAALISDRIGADSVLMIALTLFMVSGIITVTEGVAGFSNEGVLTVMTLFVVAEGISKTGALDWYMQKLLGRPKSIFSAQLRLMVPIAIVSAFLNNTQVVAVMIPIVQRWAKNIDMSPQQLMIPLSFATILGGTCTLIGTSTNLVVSGLLLKRYPDDPDLQIGLFELSIYGVPVAAVGILYILLASPWLLPGGKRSVSSETVPVDMFSVEDILLGARLMPWSPAAGRSVKRSGLRNTGGIYLVSVHRAATGNVHRAVGQDFVLNAGDVLYFTGLVEEFGDFCEEHGMEVLTSDNLDSLDKEQKTATDESESGHSTSPRNVSQSASPSVLPNAIVSEDHLSSLSVVLEEEENVDELPVMEIGVTKESLMKADEAERSRSITRMIDLIRGVARDEPTVEEEYYLGKGTPRKERHTTVLGAHKVVVSSDRSSVIIGIDARDRPGLLLEISKGLLRLNLTLRHSEASVVADRSISIWRCEVVGEGLLDLEETWSVMDSLLESIGGETSQGLKREGAKVIRAVVTSTSSLIGNGINDVEFRNRFKAAIVAVQKGGRNVALSGYVFGSGDVVVLQTTNDSPLLKPPPPGFYKRGTGESGNVLKTNSFVKTFTQSLRVNVDNAQSATETKPSDLNIKRDTRALTQSSAIFSDDDVVNDKENLKGNEESDVEELGESLETRNVPVVDEKIWKDLFVIFSNADKRNDRASSREFLTAMQIAPKSRLSGRTAAETGLDKLPGVFLVSVDRPTSSNFCLPSGGNKRSIQSIASDGNSSNREQEGEVASLQTVEPFFKTVSPEVPLQDADILWFAGSAQSLGDLRRIPGLDLFENEEVEKMNEKVHDRRLVEAVIARRGPLVGKTVKEARFRTRYGAAVIAVHRDGAKVHEYPGRIKLQAGDVLLLEAGPTFIKGSADSDRAFSLLAEVKDSAPPRLRLLIPALGLTIAMLAVATSGVVSLLVLALATSIAMCALGILSEQEARDAINWEVYTTISAAFGIGTALVNSGVAGGVADVLVAIGSSVGSGNAGLFGAVYLATFLISSIVTNNAAAALLFPVAMNAAEQTGADVVLMSYCLMLGASASFMTPFGYQTNLMIYGPGGYKTSDFLKIGTPMQVVLWFFSIALLETTSTSNFYISWLSTFAALILTSGFMLCDIGGLLRRDAK